jgi:hypothetical protein
MNEATEALVHDYLEGALDEAGHRRLEEALEADPAALSEFVDQLQVHHRLGVGPESGLPAAVARELRLQADSPRFAGDVVRRLKAPPRSRFWEVAAAAAVLVSLIFFLSRRDEATPLAAGRGAILVVGRLPLEPGDTAVRERLERLAGPVSVRTALDVTAADARGRALVAVSSTSHARELAGVLRDVPVPLVTWEPRLYPDLGLTTGGVHQVDWATAKGQTHVVVVAPGHPLAAGLTGRVAVSSQPGQFSWGRVRPEAEKVAVLDGNPERVAVFGVHGPARRAGLFLFDSTATTLTDQGWSLFDAAVRWCLEVNP